MMYEKTEERLYIVHDAAELHHQIGRTYADQYRSPVVQRPTFTRFDAPHLTPRSMSTVN
jgi:hypothetical protein